MMAGYTRRNCRQVHAKWLAWIQSILKTSTSDDPFPVKGTHIRGGQCCTTTKDNICSSTFRFNFRVLPQVISVQIHAAQFNLGGWIDVAFGPPLHCPGILAVQRRLDMRVDDDLEG